MINKVCRDCGVEKPVDQFHPDRKNRDGKHSYCIECFRRRNRERYYRRKEGDLTDRRRTMRPAPTGFKVCPDCGETKPVTSFASSKRRSDGLHSYCRPCNNARSYASDRRLHGSTRGRALRRRYNLSEQDVAAMVAEQGGLCAICRERPAVHVDHDHRAGWVRGVLCFTCNVGLGNFDDDEDRLRLAVRYLRRHRRQSSPELAAEGCQVCVCCGRRRPFTDFGPRRSERLEDGSDGRQPCCAACDLAHGGSRVIVNRHGLTASQVTALMTSQGGLCGVCQVGLPEHVDHEHVTGRIRGILCFTCNTGMGNFGDDPDRLLQAANYLKGDACRIRLVV